MDKDKDTATRHNHNNNNTNTSTRERAGGGDGSLLLRASSDAVRQTTSSDFVLQWGNRKRLRCMKVQVKDKDKDDSTAPVHRTIRVDRRVVRADKDLSNQPSTTNNGGGYLNLRQRPSSPQPPPSHRVLRNMSEIAIYCKYDGEWKKKDDNSYEWCSRNNERKSIILLDDPNKVKFHDIIDGLFERLPVNRMTTDLKVSYISLSSSMPEPIFILDDFDAKCYLLDHCAISKRRSVLYVELIKKDKGGEGNEKEGFEVNEVQTCDNENNEIVRDEYFDVNMEVSDIGNAASVPGYKGGHLDEPASNEQFNQKTTTTAPTPTQECMCIDPETVVDHCEPLATDDICISYTFDDGMSIAIGQEFSNKNEIKNLVINSSLKACFDFKIVRSTTKLFVVKCSVSDCKWALRAAKISNSDCFSLRTYHNIHTCSSSSVDNKNRQATSQLVADMLKKEFPGRLDTPSPSSIMKIMKNRGVTISYFKAWNGKKIAASDVRGTPEISFEILPSYLHMIKIMNPGTVTHLVVEEGHKFKYLFIALGACIEGFKAMRKVIAVDGTFLKTKYKGTLIVATAQDGNYHQYPLAWGVVDSENDMSWNWFMSKLKELIPDDDEIVFISDRHPSIINAVAEVYKKAQHGFCAWHLSQNIKSRVSRGSRVKGNKGKGKAKVKEAVVTKFMNTAAAYTEAEFNMMYDDLKKRYPTAIQYLEEYVSVRKWARCYFTGSRYNILTTNGAECINGVLKSARTYPLIPLIDSIVEKISEWFNKHRKVSSLGSSSQLLTPMVEQALHKRYVESTFLEVRELNRTTLEYYVIGTDCSYLVDLARRTCTCKVYDIDQIPCVHALAAFPDGPNNMHNLCSKYYLKELWALAYVQTIYPVPSLSEWVIPDDVRSMKVSPPDFIIKRGKVQQTRFPSIGEYKRGKRKRIGKATTS